VRRFHEVRNFSLISRNSEQQFWFVFLRGHGTYTEGDDLKASVAGVKEQVNKLISIKPLKSRYNGEIGDVVVGRITEVQQKRWKVDTNARLESVLLLSSVNLPGGELVFFLFTDS